MSYTSVRQGNNLKVIEIGNEEIFIGRWCFFYEDNPKECEKAIESNKQGLRIQAN